MQSIILPHCWICTKRQGLNDHHVIPQAYGGVDGPQVTLCASHHTQVHTVALKNPANWDVALREDHSPEQVAKLQELVRLIAKARKATAHMERPMMVQHKFNKDRSLKLKELKYLLGKSSIANTLDALVDTVYAQCTQLKPTQEGSK